MMSIAIALTSLAIAAFALARHVVPSLDARAEAWGTALSVAVIAAVAVTYVVAMRLAPREVLE